MKLRPIYLDFETEPIESRPKYPPRPVSFSLLLPEWRSPRFYAWGHHTGGNNCSPSDASRVLEHVWQRISEQSPLTGQNMKFDLDVAETHFGLPLPPWHCYHDTMFLLFLEDPHQRELGLKPSAERLLGMPPEEQDAVKEWVLAHKKDLYRDFPHLEFVGRTAKDTGGIKPSTAGAFIAYVPGSVAGPYANGDIVRTKALFELLHHRVTVERGMAAPYDRERKIMPILLRNEREGISVNESLLQEDLAKYEKAQKTVDDWLRKALKAPDLDFNKDRQVADALDAANAVTEWNYTATGLKSVAKDNLKLRHFRDKRVAAAYSYRQKCATVLETFIRPWIMYSRNGRMSTNWNQVRQPKGAADTGGTRTGRPSSDHPNFLNMPKKFKDVGEAYDTGTYIYPAHIRDLPELPVVRRYIVPDRKGHVIGRRDFNQQELRLLAHFEDGDLQQAYLANPRLDVHSFVHSAILEITNMDFGRKMAKDLNFGYVYGQGIASMAGKMDRPTEEVQAARNAQMLALPGLATLSKNIRLRAQQGLPITTWGGRQYFPEPPKVIDGKYREFIYKLLNYLIQGSAADVTKESIIRYEEVRREGRFLLTVYDENDIDVPQKALKSEMLLLRDAMMSIEVDVPLLSDGEWGPSLGDLQDLQEPAPDLSRWSIQYADAA